MLNFPDFLRALRKSANLSQQELAEVLGVSSSLVPSLEGGTREASKKFIKKLAAELDVDYYILLAMTFSPKTISPTIKYLDENIIFVALEGKQKILIEKNAKILTRRIEEIKTT